MIYRVEKNNILKKLQLFINSKYICAKHINIFKKKKKYKMSKKDNYIRIVSFSNNQKLKNEFKNSYHYDL